MMRPICKRQSLPQRPHVCAFGLLGTLLLCISTCLPPPSPVLPLLSYLKLSTKGACSKLPYSPVNVGCCRLPWCPLKRNEERPVAFLPCANSPKEMPFDIRPSSIRWTLPRLTQTGFLHVSHCLFRTSSKCDVDFSR